MDVCCPSPTPESVHVSGEQRLKVAQDRAQENRPSLQKDLDGRRHVKHEPSGDREEPMDTSSSSSYSSTIIPNGSVNGYLGGGASLGQANGMGGALCHAASLQLTDFVTKTFRKHFVVTLNEFKRLFHLHLASMPVGQSVFSSISDHMLMDAMVHCRCRQILVPVSIRRGCRPLLAASGCCWTSCCQRFCSLLDFFEDCVFKLGVREPIPSSHSQIGNFQSTCGIFRSDLCLLVS